MWQALRFWQRDKRPPPERYEVRLEPSGRILNVAADQTILEAALAENLPFPHQCMAAMCRSCRCELQSGEIASRKPQVPPLSCAEQEAGLILACQSEPRSALRIQVSARGNRPIPGPEN